MSGYTRHWDCRICCERQESIDTPRWMTCADCVDRVAAMLCKDQIGLSFDTPGVDKDFFRRAAERVVNQLMLRWEKAEERVSDGA